MIAREKEQKIRKLLKEDRPWNYICQEAQCSPNTIGKVQEKDERRRHQVAAKSSRSKALQMYDSNYTPLDVAIKLDISPDEAKNHKLDYWMLKGMDKFEQLYRNYGHSLPFIINKFSELEARNISLKDLKEAIDLTINLPKLRYEYQQLISQVHNVTTDYNQRQYDLRNIEEAIIQKRIELRNTEIEISRLEKIKNTNEKELFRRVSPIVHEMLGNENTLLYAALIAVLRVMGKYPDFETIRKDIATLDSSMSSHILSNPNQQKTSKLIAEASDFYHHLIDRIVEKVVEQMN